MIWTNIRFRRMDEGGLRLSFSPYDFFTGEQRQLGYLMDIDGKYFDFRIFQPPTFLELGRPYNIMMKFLLPDHVSQRLFVGREFKVWHMRPIADGVVTKIDNSSFEIPHEHRFGEPDFYLMAVGNGVDGKLKACFLRYSTCPHGNDCVFGIYAQDIESAEVSARQNGKTQEMALYCPIDILPCNDTWPRRAVEIRVIGGEETENYDLYLHGERILFKDLDFASAHAKDPTVFDDDINAESVLQNTKKILQESDLFGLVGNQEQQR